jgi:hypothetical protein
MNPKELVLHQYCWVFAPDREYSIQIGFDHLTGLKVDGATKCGGEYHIIR